MAYNQPMNPYGMERWVLDRHESVIRTAEARSRLSRDESPERLAGWVALRLRLLADRLDPALEPQRAVGPHFIPNNES